MKKIIISLITFLSITTFTFSDHHITRGPDIGEIYFVGPTSTGEGIYHSTDFGETAVCVDSISEVISICADLTSGSVYRGRMPNCLYYSSNYGQYGSWIFRTAEGADQTQSGRNEGEIFKGPAMSSNDYGISFSEHSLNSCFCSIKTFEIDNQDSVGYILGDTYGITDSLFLLTSYDNFENLELQYVFSWHWSHNISLSRGYEDGELHLYKTTIYEEEKELWYSDDYGESWEFINEFNCPNLTITDIVGGRQPGELYMVVAYIQLGYEIAHIYIYHSLDYGETFTVYHPYSHGPEPYVTNFEASPISGTAPLTVQFTDLSTGENIDSWKWDFDNDGTIDSYEQNPEYTYQDTGYYSVSLTINYMQTITATRYNYIHVTGPNTIDEEGEHPEIIINNTPNPFHSETVISYSLPSNIREAEIEIYNIKGQLVRNLPICASSLSRFLEVVWDGKDDKGKDVGAGIYFCKLATENAFTIKKLMLIK